MKPLNRLLIALFSFVLLSGMSAEAQNKVKKNLPTYRYYHQSGDTLRILKISGLEEGKLYFTLLAKVGKSKLKTVLEKYAVMISDNEIEEDEEGNAIFGQEYRHYEEPYLYIFRTDAEKNSFIHLKKNYDKDKVYYRIFDYYFKRCK